MTPVKATPSVATPEASSKVPMATVVRTRITPGMRVVMPVVVVVTPVVVMMGSHAGWRGLIEPPIGTAIAATFAVPPACAPCGGHDDQQNRNHDHPGNDLQQCREVVHVGHFQLLGEHPKNQQVAAIEPELLLSDTYRI